MGENRDFKVKVRSFLSKGEPRSLPFVKYLFLGRPLRAGFVYAIRHKTAISGNFSFVRKPKPGYNKN
jgi:hypothetical protein